MTWKPTSIEVTSQSFDDVISKHKLAVIHFWAEWNAYDLQMDRVLKQIQTEYHGYAFFGAVDVDVEGHLQRCKDLRVVNVPAIASFVNGKHFETVIGLLSTERLRVKMTEWLIAAGIEEGRAIQPYVGKAPDEKMAEVISEQAP